MTHRHGSHRPPGDRFASAWQHVLALVALSSAALLAYANSFDGAFVLDSRALVLENPAIRTATLDNLRLILTRDYWQPLATDGLYRPLTTLSFLFNYAILGNADRPFGYHALNFALHLAAVSLVYALVWRFVGRLWPAAVAGAFFGLHPVGTEVVANIAGRADLLATLGVLAGLHCHIHAGTSRGAARAGWLAGLLLATGVALYSKESGLVLMGAIVAYDAIVAPCSDRARRFRTPHAAVLAVVVVYAATRWYVARIGFPPEELSPLDNPIAEAGFWAGRATALAALGRGLGLLVWPRTLSADYSCCEIPIVDWPPAAGETLAIGSALVVLAAVAGGAVYFRRRLPALAFFLAFFLVALLPTANLLAIIGSVLAERFYYLPLAGLAGVAALGAECALRRGNEPRRARLAAASAAVVAVFVAYGWRTSVRNRDWADELRLWSSAVHAAPGSAKAHKAYAVALYGTDPNQVDRAIAEAERAIAIRPDYLHAMVDLGSYHVARGDQLAARGEDASVAYAAAIEVLERARPLDAEAARRFVQRMLVHGTPREAIPDYGNLQLYNNLSAAYVRSGRLADALAAYEQSRVLEPLNPEHYVNLSAVLARIGRWEEAAITLFEAVTIAPGHQDALGRLVQMYRVFHPEGRAVLEEAPGRVRINLDDPVVRRHRCQAYHDLAEIYARAQMPDGAARARELGRSFCRPEDTATRPGSVDPADPEVDFSSAETGQRPRRTSPVPSSWLRGPARAGPRRGRSAGRRRGRR